MAKWKREGQHGDGITRHWLGYDRMVRRATVDEARAHGARVLVFEYGCRIGTAGTVKEGKRIAERRAAVSR